MIGTRLSVIVVIVTSLAGCTSTLPAILSSSQGTEDKLPDSLNVIDGVDSRSVRHVANYAGAQIFVMTREKGKEFCLGIDRLDVDGGGSAGCAAALPITVGARDGLEAKLVTNNDKSWAVEGWEYIGDNTLARQGGNDSQR